MYTFHFNMVVSVQIKKMTIGVKILYEWAVNNIDSIRGVLKFLYENRKSPAVSILLLYDEGLSAVRKITAFIVTHKYLGLGAITLYFAPNILESFTDWLSHVRVALKSKSEWKSDVSILRQTVNDLKATIPHVTPGFG